MFRRFHPGKRKHIQPVDLKGQLAAVMRREKRELPYGDYAPNYYVIQLNPDDFQRWAGLRRKVIDQLRNYLMAEIHRENYLLEAELWFDFQESAEKAPGDMHIQARFQDPTPQDDAIFVPMLSHEDGILGMEKDPPTEIELPLDLPPDNGEGTQIFHSEEPSPAYSPEDQPNVLARLTVLQGEDQGLSFDIKSLPVIVGRTGKNADIALRDTHKHISRDQFEISQQEEGAFALTDLRCRTDLQIFVDGKHVDPMLPLCSGDVIQLGAAQKSLIEMEFTVL